MENLEFPGVVLTGGTLEVEFKSRPGVALTGGTLEVEFKSRPGVALTGGALEDRRTEFLR